VRALFAVGLVCIAAPAHPTPRLACAEALRATQPKDRPSLLPVKDEDEAAGRRLDAVLARLTEAASRNHGRASGSLPERQLFLVATLAGEVHNGGFHQFFWNSSGDAARETRDALAAIGLPEVLALFDCALSAFPRSTPERNRKKRKRALDSMSPEMFGPLDRALWDDRTFRSRLIAFEEAHRDELAGAKP
jgi:hypothetical protein